MKNVKHMTAAGMSLLLAVGVLTVGLTSPPAITAQDKSSNSAGQKHAIKSGDGDKDLAAQVRELQSKIVTLEAALKQGHQGTSSGRPAGKPQAAMPKGMMGDKKMGMGMMGMGGGGMEGMDRDEMMKMMQQMMGEMQGKGMGGKAGMGGMMDMDMKSGGMGMMEDGMDMMGMMGKGSMGGMGAKGANMKMTSALPGFPGASHVYHIGATDFFLDHPEHISLTTEQQTTLNRAKQKSLLDKSKAQRQIDESEQELWELTSADEPDAEQIQAKVQEIEKLRGEQRLAFIRSVGEAAKVLTDEQRQVLLGQTKPDAHKTHLPATK